MVADFGGGYGVCGASFPGEVFPLVDGFDGRLPYRNVDAITNTTPTTKNLTEKEKQEACMEEVARMITLGNFPHKEAEGTNLHGRSQVLQDEV